METKRTNLVLRLAALNEHENQQLGSSSNTFYNFNFNKQTTKMKLKDKIISLLMTTVVMLILLSVPANAIHIAIKRSNDLGDCGKGNVKICDIVIERSATPSVDASLSGGILTLEFLDDSQKGRKMLTFDDDITLSEEVSQELETEKQVTILRGSFPIDYSRSKFGVVMLPVELVPIPLIDCSLVQDGHFENVTTYLGSSDISITSTPWKPGILSPQYGANTQQNPDCDNRGGSVYMWGNNVVGESIIQTLGSGGIKKGKSYNFSLCARYHNGAALNHVRVRVVAYNTTAPHRGTYTSPSSVVIYETPNITSSTWQNFTSCNWVADANYTNIEVMPVNSSSVNDGDFVTWCNIDNLVMCEHEPCEGFNIEGYPTPASNGNCCYNVDLSYGYCYANLGQVKITVPSGVTIASSTAPTGWVQSGVSPTITWNHSLPVGSGTYTGGNICFNATTSAFIAIVEWLDNKNNVICKKEFNVKCPPPCLDLGKPKITCIGHDAAGNPQYNFCVTVVNNGGSQPMGITVPGGTFAPNPITVTSGTNTICGVITMALPAPTSGIFILSTMTQPPCKDSLNITFPQDCPPQKCLEVQLQLSCKGTTQAGLTSYSYSGVILNMSGIMPNTVTITSNGGVEAVLTNVPASLPISGVLQYATPVGGKICLVFVIRNVNGVVICVRRFCFQAPQCPSCCTDFDKGVKVTNVYSSGVVSGNYYVWMNMSFAPNRPIRNMTYTIVSASRKKGGSTTWDRIYGDIGCASPIPGLGLRYYGGMSPSSSFQVPTLKTREVEWGTNFAGVSTFGPTSVCMLYPVPVSHNDSLDFFVRIAMTDIKCIKCDTLIHYKIKMKSIIWNDPHLKDNGNSGKTDFDDKESESLLSASSESPSIKLKMATKDKGNLQIDIPVISSSASDKIKIVEVGFVPEETVDLSSFTPATSNFKAMSRTDTLSCSGSMTEGESAKFDVTFNNPIFNRWRNTVIIKYLIGSEPDTLTGTAVVIASILSEQGGDSLVETGDKTIKTRTYSLSFTNSNKSKRGVANIELKMPKGVHLLAFGSGLPDTINLQTAATYKNDTAKIENYLIPLAKDKNNNGILDMINPNETVKPLYITVSGAESGFSMGFTTTDDEGGVLSEGTVVLRSPLSNVETGKDKDAANKAVLYPIYPNPTMNSISIQFALPSGGDKISLEMYDAEGKELPAIFSNQAVSAGEQVVVYNANNLPNGKYFVRLVSSKGTSIQSFTVVR